MSEPYKKAKIEESEKFIFMNFSSVLTQPFYTFQKKTKAYAYEFSEFKGFGILFPMAYNPLPDTLKPLGIRQISSVKMEQLKLFQNVL